MRRKREGHGEEIPRGAPSSLLGCSHPEHYLHASCPMGPPMTSSPSRFINFYNSQLLSTHYMRNTAGEMNKTDKTPLFLELTFRCEHEIINKLTNGNFPFGLRLTLQASRASLPILLGAALVIKSRDSQPCLGS